MFFLSRKININILNILIIILEWQIYKKQMQNSKFWFAKQVTTSSSQKGTNLQLSDSLKIFDKE